MSVAELSKLSMLPERDRPARMNGTTRRKCGYRKSPNAFRFSVYAVLSRKVEGVETVADDAKREDLLALLKSDYTHMTEKLKADGQRLIDQKNAAAMAFDIPAQTQERVTKAEEEGKKSWTDVEARLKILRSKKSLTDEEIAEQSLLSELKKSISSIRNEIQGIVSVPSKEGYNAVSKSYKGCAVIWAAVSKQIETAAKKSDKENRRLIKGVASEIPLPADGFIKIGYVDDAVSVAFCIIGADNKSVKYIVLLSNGGSKVKNNKYRKPMNELVQSVNGGSYGSFTLYEGSRGEMMVAAPVYRKERPAIQNEGGVLHITTTNEKFLSLFQDRSKRPDTQSGNDLRKLIAQRKKQLHSDNADCRRSFNATAVRKSAVPRRNRINAAIQRKLKHYAKWVVAHAVRYKCDTVEYDSSFRRSFSSSLPWYMLESILASECYNAKDGVIKYVSVKTHYQLKRIDGPIVYFVIDDVVNPKFVKIGSTKEWENRKKAYRTHCIENGTVMIGAISRSKPEDAKKLEERLKEMFARSQSDADGVSIEAFALSDVLPFLLDHGIFGNVGNLKYLTESRRIFVPDEYIPKEYKFEDKDVSGEVVVKTP